MPRRLLALFSALCALPLALTIALAAPAAAHEERPAGFPDGQGVVPAYLGLSNANHRVVCTSTATSRNRIAHRTWTEHIPR